MNVPSADELMRRHLPTVPKITYILCNACLSVLLSWPARLVAQTNEVEEIPPLRPPRAEIPPSFWEEHGLLAVGLGLVGLLVLVAVIWLLTRPRPAQPVPPAVQARRALEPLRPVNENGKVLSEVSQTLRRYIADVFQFPPGELTTTEFCRTIEEHQQPGTELTQRIVEFLRKCDERKFAPSPPQPPLGAVSCALELIESTETRLAELQRASAAASPNTGGAR